VLLGFITKLLSCQHLVGLHQLPRRGGQISHVPAHVRHLGQLGRALTGAAAITQLERVKAAVETHAAEPWPRDQPAFARCKLRAQRLVAAGAKHRDASARCLLGLSLNDVNEGSESRRRLPRYRPRGRPPVSRSRRTRCRLEELGSPAVCLYAPESGSTGAPGRARAAHAAA
jgi:hypothetical protein